MMKLTTSGSRGSILASFLKVLEFISLSLIFLIMIVNIMLNILSFKIQIN
jgi:hypothetical protein